MARNRLNVKKVIEETFLSLKECAELMQKVAKTFGRAADSLKGASPDYTVLMCQLMGEASLAMRAANEHLAKAVTLVTPPSKTIRPDIQAEINRLTQTRT